MNSQELNTESYEPTEDVLRQLGLTKIFTPSAEKLIAINPGYTKSVKVERDGTVVLQTITSRCQTHWKTVWRGKPESSYDFNTLYDELVEAFDNYPDDVLPEPKLKMYSIPSAKDARKMAKAQGKK